MPNFDPAQAFNESNVAPEPEQPFDDLAALRTTAASAPTPAPIVATPADIAAAQAAGVSISPALLPAAPAAPTPETVPATPTPETPLQASPVASGATPSGGPGQPDALSGAITEGKAAGQEATEVGQGAVEIAKEKATADAQADQVKADEAAQAAERLQQLQARQKVAYDESVNQFQKAKDEVRNFKFQDYWANKSVGTTVLAAIGMLLGGASFDAHHVNQAVNVIQTSIDRDAKQQLDYLHSKEHLAELSQQGVRDTQSYLAHEMQNFTTVEALKKEAIAREIDSRLSTVRGKQNINEAQAVAAKLREQAAKDAQQAIIQGTHNRVMLSEISLNRAKAANEGANKANRVKTAEDTAYEKRLESLYKKNGQAIAKQADEAQDLLKTAKENPSALQQGLVLERVVALAQGGSKAGLGALRLVAPHAGSDPDKIISTIKESLTGNKGEAVQKNLQKVLENIAQESNQRLDKAKKTFDTSTASQRKKFGQTIDDTRTAIFGSDNPDSVAAQPQWKPIPRSLTGAPQLAGKKEVLVSPDGSIQDAR